MTKQVYKIWIDIEDCLIDGAGEVLDGALTSLPAGSPADGCQGTFDTYEDAVAFANKLVKKASK